jgi:hypothetical protein
MAGHRCDDFGLRHVLSGQRDIGKLAIAGEEPLAAPFEKRPRRGRGGDDLVLLPVRRGDSVAGHFPRVIDHGADVGELLLREIEERGEIISASGDGAGG